MKTNGSNANQLATNPKEKKGTLGEWLNERKESLNNALPANTVNVDRFMQSAFLAITNPKMPDLVRCSKESIFRSLKEAAAYGLELNGMLGQAYLIPYNEKGVMTAHLQCGYKGLIALARRSNTIKTIAAEAIHENDIFDCELASGRSIHHKINIFKERGEVVAYYCLVELANGGEQFKVMSKKEIEKHRDKFSKAYNPKDPNNIWNKNFDAMALKTCVIQALKLCPISIEAMDAVAKEEKDDIKDFSEQVEYTISDEVPETKEETPAIEDKKQQKKEEPVQEQSSFDEANGMTDEEMAAANEAFDSTPENVNDIF
ncbi:MAG: recombinase RecT [Treponema sp.]|nr:recombinase RecT [Treponema sp.]